MQVNHQTSRLPQNVNQPMYSEVVRQAGIPDSGGGVHRDRSDRYNSSNIGSGTLHLRRQQLEQVQLESICWEIVYGLGRPLRELDKCEFGDVAYYGRELIPMKVFPAVAHKWPGMTCGIVRTKDVPEHVDDCSRVAARYWPFVYMVVLNGTVRYQIGQDAGVLVQGEVVCFDSRMRHQVLRGGGCRGACVLTLRRSRKTDSGFISKIPVPGNYARVTNQFDVGCSGENNGNDVAGATTLENKKNEWSQCAQRRSPCSRWNKE